MKQFFVVLWVLSFCLSIGGGVCADEKTKIKVVTTLFPLYDFIKQVGNDYVTVSLLLPPGVEAHSFEPKPSDIMSINKADVFIYTGDVMEPWVSDVLTGIRSTTVHIVNVRKALDISPRHESEYEDDHDAEKKEHPHGEDPHIWLDPIIAQKIVACIAETLSKKDPGHASYYQERAQRYHQQLVDLDASFRSLFERVPRKTILHGGHFAFGYFAQRYGLQYISPYAGFSPNAEPTPERIAVLITRMREYGMRYIFYEELIEPRVARVIAEETGAELLLLHGAHNVSKEEMKSGITYLNIMQHNLAMLTKGLGKNE